MGKIAYAGIIKSSIVDYLDFKTIVMAEDEEEAKLQVLEKYQKDVGVLFAEDDIQIRKLL